MKNTVYFLLLAVAIACGKKEDTVVPDAATRVAGTYDVTKIESPVFGSFAYPQSYTSSTGVVSTLSGQIVLVRKTASSVDITYTEKETGQPDDVTNINGVDVKGNDLYTSTTKIGTADGTTLTFSNVSGTITAKKK